MGRHPRYALPAVRRGRPPVFENLPFREINAAYLKSDLERTRDRLVAQARTGHLGALILLKERYRIRLPLVEGRLAVTLPWMRKDERGA